ncbi:UNVERIFIED_CONTAM: hypothetical protein Sradi_4508600 [Sesamum radiatum]|uniref:Reverse transcriptase n=1 Tax=Sesamum radiatum TaxID=300843 RepID=A0AAW2N9U2_SESRA
MIPKETPPQQQQEEGSDQAEMERRSQQAPGSPRRPPPSEREIEEETRQEGQSFSVIYMKHATFIMLEPENFETRIKQSMGPSNGREIKMIERNNTWELTDRPKTKKYWSKMDLQDEAECRGSIQKHKARLVAKGYSQHAGPYTELLLQ